jgi:Kdo2-lipid IVA lauroyltransferase/acyltransferase
MGRVFGWIWVRLPRRVLSAIFGALGVLLFLLGIRRRVVVDNLRLAFPERTDAERRDIARATYRHLGEMVPEFLRVPYLGPAELEEMFEYQGWENLQRAAALGKGVIACTGHFGHFDLLAAAHALRGVPMTTISRKMQVGLWKGTRARAGVQEIYVNPGETFSAAVKALRAGRVLGYVIDQSEPNRNAIYPTFFGVPAATAATPAVLSRRTGAPVLFAVSLPLGGGRHRVVIEGPLFPPETGDHQRDALAFMQDLNDRLEVWVRRNPEQWYWLHRRWKRSREAPGAPRPAAPAQIDPPDAAR